MARQEQIDTELPEGLVNLHLSYGAMNVKVDPDDAPRFRDQVYLVIGGHIKTIGEASAPATGLNLTVVGDAQFITKEQFEQLRR